MLSYPGDSNCNRVKSDQMYRKSNSEAENLTKKDNNLKFMMHALDRIIYLHLLCLTTTHDLAVRRSGTLLNC
jgi:hypothetical protein